MIFILMPDKFSKLLYCFEKRSKTILNFSKIRYIFIMSTFHLKAANTMQRRVYIETSQEVKGEEAKFLRLMSNTLIKPFTATKENKPRRYKIQRHLIRMKKSASIA